ncbi:MAG: agmatinase [Pontixanthobacter sp.]
MTIRMLGIPHDLNSSYLRGAAAAPEAIARAVRSESANMFSELGHDLGSPELFTEVGEVALAGLAGQAAYDAIYTAVTSQLETGCRLLSIGGDHSISFPVVMAHTRFYQPLNILHFDAHPDLYENFEGNSFSHASTFARLMESGQIVRLVQIGIRTLNDHQREQTARFGVEQHEMRDLSRLSSIHFDGPVYISVDLDALDPAYAPGVSHHEPGGLTTRQIMEVIQTVPGTIVGADIVELNPARDINGMSAMVAAKIAKELAGRMITDAVNTVR